MKIAGLTDGLAARYPETMKSPATCIPALLLRMFLLGIPLAGTGAAALAQTHAVQPAGRIVGQWVAEAESIDNYLDALLLPANAQCEQFEGSIVYTFTGGESRTLSINSYGPVVHVARGRMGRPADQISFGLGISYQSAYSISDDGNVLDYGTNPDVNTVTIDNLTVNGVEVMRESGDVSLLGLPIAFTSSQMAFEFLGDDRLKLTPILPASTNGVAAEPNALILRRK